MSIFFYTKEEYFNSVMLLICAGLFAYGYFKYGTVYAAFQELKKGKFDKAEKLISKIKHPERLSKGQKGYYHFTLGAIAANNKDWDLSYLELNKALDIGLRTKNDKSIVLLNLANAELERNNIEQASDYIAKVKTFELNAVVKSETDRIEKEINNAKGL